MKTRRQPPEQATCEEAALAGMLREAGESLPASPRTDDIRASFLGKVEAKRADAARLESVARSRATARGRLVPALSGLAIALVAVAVIMMSLGFAAVHAMPGSPLYSVKRATERVQLSFLGGKELVNALLKQADKRMSELDYAMSHNMGSWLYPLTSDAEEDIQEAKQEGSTLGETEAGETNRKAGDIVVEHEQTVRESVRELPEQERESVERWLDREVREREQEEEHNGEGPGSGAAPPATGRSSESEHRSVEARVAEPPETEHVAAEALREPRHIEAAETPESTDLQTRSDEPTETRVRATEPTDRNEAEARSTTAEEAGHAAREADHTD